MQHITRYRLMSSAALLITSPLLVLALAGCTATNTSSDAGTETKDTYKQEHQDWELKFARCLQSKGIDIPDPDPVKGFPDVKHDDALKQASASCQAEIGGPPLRSDRKEMTPAEMLDLGLKNAACLREHGVNVADPTLEHPAVSIDSAEEGAKITEEISQKCFPSDQSGT